MEDRLRAALFTSFEAARQASRGKYDPDQRVVDALALLSEVSPIARAAAAKLWRECSRVILVEINVTTTNHLRGLRALACWRKIAAAIGADLTPGLLAECYASTRTPADRGYEYTNRAQWLEEQPDIHDPARDRSQRG